MLEDVEAAYDVERLPDAICSDKSPRGLISRIHERRLQCYNDLLRRLRCLLIEIGQTAEQAILATTNALQTALTEQYAAIVNLENSCRRDPKNNLSLAAFRRADEEIQKSFTLTAGHIANSQCAIEALEKQREINLTKAFNTSVEKMLHSSHLLPHDVSRVMQQEMLAVNQVVLRNQRAINNLHQRLVVDNLYRKRQADETLSRYVGEWRQEEIERSLTVAYMALQTACDVSPERIQAIIDETSKRFLVLRKTRCDMLADVMSSAPPSGTMKKCRVWLREMQDLTDDMCAVLTEGVDNVSILFEDRLYEFHEYVQTTTANLQAALGMTADELEPIFNFPLSHRTAEFKTHLETDLQFYHQEISRQRDREYALLEDLFGFLHGAMWHWELHLDSLSLAEHHLDTVVEKQRGLIHALIETKTPKVRNILDALRHSWTASTTNAQIHSADSLFSEVRNMIKEAEKKSQRIGLLANNMFQILLRGYTERLLVYLQVNSEHPIANPFAPPESEHIQSRPSTSTFHQAADHHRSHSGHSDERYNVHSSHSHHAPKPLEPINDPDHLESGGRHLPDIPLTGRERVRLTEFLVSPLDEERFTIRLKSLPHMVQDPRIAPPGQPILCNGMAYVGKVTPLESCFRFYEEPTTPPLPFSPNHPVKPIIQMTESQMAIVQDLTFALKPRQLIVNLDELLAVLATTDVTLPAVRLLRRQLREAFLKHLCEEWPQVLHHFARCFIDYRHEGFQTEFFLQTRLCKLRAAAVVDGAVQLRGQELVKHEATLKSSEQQMQSTIVGFKADIAEINKKINEKLALTKANFSVIEKGFPISTRLSQIAQLRAAAKNENTQYMAYVRALVSEFKQHVHSTNLQLVTRLRAGPTDFKKFSEGGNYTNEEFRHTEQVLHKLADKLTSTEKSMNDECRAIEQRRKGVIDAATSKLLERVPHHEQDVELVCLLTKLLNTAQTQIKQRVTAINTSLSASICMQKALALKVAMLRHNPSAAHFDTAVFVAELQTMLYETRNGLAQVGCVKVTQGVRTPPIEVVVPDQEPARDGEFGRRSTYSRKSKIEPTREVPNDFQLATVDGMLSPILPRPFVPVEPRVPAVSTKGLDSPARHVRHSDLPRGSMISNGILMAQKKKQKKMERYQVFGDAEPHADTTLLEAVHGFCWHALTETLALGEEYYKIKGSRPITRPTLLPDSFENFAEKMCRRLLNYYSQSEHCALNLSSKFADFAGQVTAFAVEAPSLLLNWHFMRYQQETQMALQLCVQKYDDTCKRIQNPRDGLDGISLPNELLQKNSGATLLAHATSEAQTIWLTQWTALTMSFLLQFSQTTNALFKAADNVVVPEEITAPASPLDTSAESGRHATSSPTSKDVQAAVRALRTGATWTALDLTLVGVKCELNMEVRSLRTTPVHVAIDEARRIIFTEFVDFCTFCRKQFSVVPVMLADIVDVAHDQFLSVQLKRLEVLEKIK